jgi:hypothetical protein
MPKRGEAVNLLGETKDQLISRLFREGDAREDKAYALGALEAIEIAGHPDVLKDFEANMRRRLEGATAAILKGRTKDG